MEIKTITDEVGNEHILVYKSESEWESYPKANWDALQEQRAKQSEQSGTL